MSGPACRCGKRECWAVAVYKGNFSAFNGYRFTPSDHSEVVCNHVTGGCGARWRTKATYVEDIWLRGGREYRPGDYHNSPPPIDLPSDEWQDQLDPP